MPPVQPSPLRSALRLFDRLAGYLPLTWAGLALLVASLVALVPYGLWLQDLVLLVLGATGVALVAAAALVVGAGSVALRLAVRRAPAPGDLALEVGREGPSGFVIHRPLWIPWLDVAWEVRAPDVRVGIHSGGRALTERWTPRRRGLRHRVVRRFVIRDAFGLASLRFDREQARELRFTPALGALAQVAIVHGLAGGDQLPHPDGSPEGDLADMRSYGAGDPIRFVLWKVFARTRQLVVRTPERALAPTRRTLAYLVASLHDEAAAAAARVATSTGALGEDWVFGADGAPATASDSASAFALILGSADHPDGDGANGLDGFLASQESFQARRALVFAPGRPGPWVPRVLAASRAARLDIFVCIDGVRREPPLGALGRALLRPAPDRADGVRPTRRELAALCEALAAAGDVRVIDRDAGQIYGAPHVAALRREVA